ncbi:MAG: TlyA family RNA methyltransferase [Eggerthellaceae bacterium]|jgi:23S rRNA (cytidine1920-2'-O)/16S rRNA (cytidine1409-2'-O)-methyltransferase|nr:TlyA family RNA methyltransferase [Eggerthellaceae bacterium]
MKKVRLDTLLVRRGYFPDEEAALRAVLAHEVKVNDVYAQSAALLVSPDVDTSVKGRKRFVSRGGHKLQAALDAFSIEVAGKRCLDIGASTGGFSDCLLQAGAAHVVCVDVNYGQLAWSLRQDERVTVFERTNIKQVDAEELGSPFDIIVADVSFISLASLASIFVRFAQVGSVFIGLVKPQFESRAGETDRGIVHDPLVQARVVDEVKAALLNVSFVLQGEIESPLKGAEGNREFLVYAVYEGAAAVV